MHATAHKRAVCQIPPWRHKNADRTCEHGDSRLLADLKRQRRQRLRTDDKREARA